MNAATETALREQLLDRRRRMQTAIGSIGPVDDLVRLLQEVDSALSRMDARTFGVCAVCDETIDEKDLLGNPLMRYCLCSLTPAQQDELQNDLDLAWKIQTALLPQQDVRLGGWERSHINGDPEERPGAPGRVTRNHGGSR